MHSMDLGLLAALDVLLQEESVLGAARRMGLSAPAMSRTLSRLRELLGDPLLVRAGRGLVPTARALELGPRVREIVAAAEGLVQGDGARDRATLTRSFVVRTGDALLGVVGLGLLDALRAEAPGVTLRFVPQGDEDVAALREGRIDLDVGVIAGMGPEVRVQTLLKDRFVGVVRAGHPLLRGKMTAKRFAGHDHVGVSRQGKVWGPIDEALATKRLHRVTALVVPSVYAAQHAIAGSDLVGAMASRFLGQPAASLGLVTFALPVSTPEIAIAQAWHPRVDADPAHRWLRGAVREVYRRCLPPLAASPR